MLGGWGIIVQLMYVSRRWKEIVSLNELKWLDVSFITS